MFFETQRDEAGQLRKSLDGAARTRVESSDGFAGLRALLPPPERRGCVLIDPPFEERDDYTRVHDAVADALQRFPDSACWCCGCPSSCARISMAGSPRCGARVDRPMLASLLWMHPTDSRAALNGSALVVVNPPYLVEEGMREWLPELRDLLGGAQGGCEVLAG